MEKKYCIWDNDRAVLVCATDNRKKAIVAVLSHLIEFENASDLIMFSEGTEYEDGRNVIREALTLSASL